MSVRGDPASEDRLVPSSNPSSPRSSASSGSRLVSNVAATSARSAPGRTISALPRPPSANPSASTRIDFPAPVSPVSAVSPAPNSTSSRWMIVKSRTARWTSTGPNGGCRAGEASTSPRPRQLSAAPPERRPNAAPTPPQRRPDSVQESAPQKDSSSPARNDAVGATPASPLPSVMSPCLATPRYAPPHRPARARRDLAPELVYQSVQALVLVAVHVAPERALAHPRAASSWLSRRSCHPPPASANLIRRISCSTRVRVMGRLLGAHHTGQTTCYYTGQTICSRQRRGEGFGSAADGC